MPDTPRRRVFLGLLAAGLLAAAALPPSAVADDPIDLEGTWFVLIHFQDSSTANPDVMRWADRVWIFAHKGTRLEWTEYPLVVFQDASGRFEATAGNPRSRVLAAWKPNHSQRRTIAAGPRVNTRGMTTKSLKGSDAKGWRSSGRRPTVSASVMSYHQQLSIQGLTDKPIFERLDSVGSRRSKDADGGSRYVVEAISESGRSLNGGYDRDGIRQGTFRMWRTKAARGLIERETTPNEEFVRKETEKYLEQLEAAKAAGIELKEPEVWPEDAILPEP